jgi:hypothetical protein
MVPRPSEASLRRIKIIGFSFVLVLVPFVIYYYFWVSNQTKYFTGRDLRVLAAVTRHVEESVKSQSDVFKNAVDKFVVDLDGRDDPEEPEDQVDNDKKKNIYNRLKEDSNSFKAGFQWTVLDRLKADDTKLTITNLDRVEKPADESWMKSPRMEIQQEDNQRFLYLSYIARYPSEEETLFEDKAEEGKASSALPPLYLNFKVKTNLTDLVGQFVDKRQIEDNQDSYGGDGFDAIILTEVEDSVDVIFQESSSKLRIAALNNLTAVADGSKVDLKLLGQSTNVADVKVGASEYKLFFQPLQMPLARFRDHKQPISWMACGFVESARFRRESWSVSYTVLIIFGFLVALVALSWPFLKLLLIGPKDRVRPIDTYLLVVSAVMITALFTLFCVFSVTYLRAERTLDGKLGTFANSLQNNFERELSDALQEIDDLNCHPKLFETPYFPRPARCQKIETRRTENPEEDAYPASRRLILRDDQPKHYPYFISAFWADRFGHQRVKWSVRSSLTNNIRIDDREYFSKLRQGAPYTFKEHQFFLLPIVSKTTGQSEVIISKAIFPPEEEQQNLKKAGSKLLWMSALDTRLLSLMQPVVPAGFGFAVIDDDGKVLFHSDEKRHLGENFFEESDNNQELRAAVLGRSEQPLNVSYLGKGHSMYVRPMGHFGWTAIAFRNKDYLRTTFSEILTLCLALFFAHLLFMLTVMLAIYLINRISQNSATWFWPAPDKTKVYISLMVINLGLTALSASAVWWLTGLWKIAVPVASALFAMLYFVWVLQRNNGAPLSAKLIDRLQQRSFLNHRAVYTVNATLLFALISIIPAYACYRLAYAEEMKLFIKEGQLDLARNMARREERLRTQYIGTGVNASAKQPMEEFLARRLNDTTYDVYSSHFFDTKLKEASVQHGGEDRSLDVRLIRFFKKFVPLFNQSSIQRHALMWPAADDSWKWEERTSEDLILHAGASLTTQKSTPRDIVSTQPHIDGLGWWLIWPILLFIVALLVSYMCRQIFLFNRDETASDELNGFSADLVCQNLFLVLNPPFVGRRELLRRLGLDKAAFERIDVQQSAEVEKWFKHRNPPALPGATQPSTPALPIILDNFDYGCENPTYNQQRLKLLEKLFELKRVAIAVSNLEPDRFMNGKSDGNTENGTSPVMTERWTGAVSRFLRVSLEDFGEPVAFKTTVTNRKKQVLSDDKLTPEAKQQVEAVFERIERECSPRACLQSIGEGIANQRNISTQTPEGVTRQVFVQAMPYYKSIWRVCSDDEKLTLSHLAHDGLLSSNDPDLERLMKKGLIVREPAVRLMNESFKCFVLGVEDGEAMAECEAKAKKSSNWEVLKVPLSIGVASVIVFLLLTQREIYNSALPIITAITAGVPTFFKLISVFSGDSGGKSGG